jgi:hypothetical protein
MWQQVKVPTMNIAGGFHHLSHTLCNIQQASKSNTLFACSCFRLAGANSVQGVTSHMGALRCVTLTLFLSPGHGHGHGHGQFYFDDDLFIQPKSLPPDTAVDSAMHHPSFDSNHCYCLFLTLFVLMS